MEPLFAEAERKNKLLRQTAGGGIEQMNELLTEWDRFEVMMESHQMMIRERVCVLTIGNEIGNPQNHRNLVFHNRSVSC